MIWMNWGRQRPNEINVEAARVNRQIKKEKQKNDI